MGERDTNPGSTGAVRKGCTCPIWDNARGAGMPGPDGEPQFWISSDCPLHATPTPTEAPADG